MHTMFFCLILILDFSSCKENKSPQKSKSGATINNNTVNDPVLQNNPNASRPSGAFLSPLDHVAPSNLPEDSKEEFIASLSSEEDFLSDHPDT